MKLMSNPLKLKLMIVGAFGMALHCSAQWSQARRDNLLMVEGVWVAYPPHQIHYAR